MHEYGVTRRILESLIAQLERENVSKVVSVRFQQAAPPPPQPQYSMAAGAD